MYFMLENDTMSYLCCIVFSGKGIFGAKEVRPENRRSNDAF